MGEKSFFKEEVTFKFIEISFSKTVIENIRTVKWYI